MQQASDRSVVLGVQYGDGTGEVRSIPRGGGSITVSLFHQYPHPPLEATNLEVLTVTNRTTGGEAFGFFKHYGPPQTESRMSRP